MKNLKSFEQNGMDYNYVALISEEPLQYEVFKSRKAAEHYNECESMGKFEILTFRQAAKKYPNAFIY